MMKSKVEAFCENQPFQNGGKRRGSFRLNVPPVSKVESVEEPEVVPLVDTGYDSEEDRSGRKVVDIARGGDDASDRGSGDAGRKKKKKERKTADEEDRDRDRDREKKKEEKTYVCSDSKLEWIFSNF